MKRNGLTIKDGLVVLHDIPASYRMYSSACSWCKFFDSSKFLCAAYREAIPDKFLDGSTIHKTIEPGQEGNFVFTPKSQDIPQFLK